MDVVETRDDAVPVGVAADERLALVPDGVDRADRIRGAFAPVDQPERGLFVGDGDREAI